MQHSDDIGGTSRDLRTLGYPDPTEAQLPKDDRETRIQRFGRWNYRAGIATLAGALFASVGIAVTTEGPTFDNPIAQMWGVLGLITVMLFGAVLIIVGAEERIRRPDRAMVRQQMRRTKDNSDRLDILVNAIDMIAKHMPEHDQIVNWRGWAAAERAREAEGTGTDGTAQRPPRLGLVPRGQ